jgi:hypothetical protein
MLDLPAMADHSTSSDDFSALWGPSGEGLLESGAPEANLDLAAEFRSIATATTNGNGVGLSVIDEPGIAVDEDGVTRLVAELRTPLSDVVSRADLDIVRGEMEGAFTHQLAVALYELLTASNERLASVEDHLQRRIAESESAQADRLAVLVEEHRRATDEITTAVHEGLDAAIDRLAGYQRDPRHEVEGLGGGAGDAPSSPEPEVLLAGVRDRRADELATLRDEVAALREELAEVRGALRSRPRKSGGFSRRSRLG